MEGQYIGVFGQDDHWILNDVETFAAQPEDLRIEAQIEKRRDEMIKKQKEDLKRSVIEAWKGIIASSKSDDDLTKGRRHRINNTRSGRNIQCKGCRA